MPHSHMPKNAEFLPGTLDMLILKTLTLGPNHGYGIAQHIRRTSEEALKIGEGSLYPALQRLLVNEWVLADWGSSDTGRKVRMYRITASGKSSSNRKWKASTVARRNRARYGCRMRIWNRLRSLVDRRPFEHDLNDEMTAHREMIEREFIEQGMSSEDAKFAASREFGNTTTFMESSREQWQFAWLDTLTRDIRFALRRLVKQPALTITAALTIALGIGANTAIVSVLKTVLLNPLGLKDTHRINVATVRLEKLNMRKASTSAVRSSENCSR